MKPMIKYRGGKGKEIGLFEDLFPRGFSRYVEPFVGGGAVFFHLEPRRAVINDLNGSLIRFYLGIRDCYPSVRKEIDALAEAYAANRSAFERARGRAEAGIRVENLNENLYYRVRDMYNGRAEKIWSDAALYYFINRTAYSGMIRYNSRGEFNVPFGRYGSICPGMVTDAHRVLLSRTDIYNRDYSEILSMTRGGDFVFLDPPYDCVFTDYGNAAGGGDFTEDSHRRLAADFRNLGCRALMVIGGTELTRSLYGPYVRREYVKRYGVNIRNRFRSESTHLVVTNYG